MQGEEHTRHGPKLLLLSPCTCGGASEGSATETTSSVSWPVGVVSARRGSVSARYRANAAVNVGMPRPGITRSGRHGDVNKVRSQCRQRRRTTYGSEMGTVGRVDGLTAKARASAIERDRAREIKRAGGRGRARPHGVVACWRARCKVSKRTIMHSVTLSVKPESECRIDRHGRHAGGGRPWRRPHAQRLGADRQSRPAEVGQQQKGKIPHI